MTAQSDVNLQGSSTPQAGASFVPGTVVRVRDESWTVRSTELTESGMLVKVRGLSELVRDTDAAFYTNFDEIEVLDPHTATIVADDSSNYRRSRLFLETTLRKTPEPATSPRLTVSHRMLANNLTYQHSAVAQALDPAHIRPRILLADAVGLGKTLEIGMILSELVTRGRGENILIVTPQHVLEQMQHELWTRFALPFVRLDSVGIQKVRQTIPASRNPFTYFKRVIISIDTLKSPRYRAHLKRRFWDAVVIDESHNLTNAGTQNNELARILAPRTDALILASATPHNGKEESFAELVRLLDPTAVAPDGTIDKEATKKLIIRRHRYSPDVAREVGADWAEREAPRNIEVPASPEENAIADELASTWLYSANGAPTTNPLFGWTLAKAFLSSPAALTDTIDNRIRTIGNAARGSIDDRELTALTRLRTLAQATTNKSAKFDRLIAELKEAGVGRRSPTRAVVFTERVATIKDLAARIPKALGLAAKNIGILHGGLTDVEQQEVVEDFKRGSSDLRVLVTGDIASEGVNLHAECHHLFHFDIPWSLIRIEQRNGRIDRYGQRKNPVITTLLLTPETEEFSGDIRVLTKLVEKEHEAHKVLGDAAALMGEHSVRAEENAILDVIRGKSELDDVVKDTGEVTLDSLNALFFRNDDDLAPAEETGLAYARGLGLYESTIDYVDEALEEALGNPYQKIGWKVDRGEGVASLKPPRDLQRRLQFLPQSYVKDRRVTEELKLAFYPRLADRALHHAREAEDTSWPALHYLGPLHPIIDWASDLALARLASDEVLAVRGDVNAPVFLMLGAVSNQRGQLLNRTFLAVENGMVRPFGSARELLAYVGLTERRANPGPMDVADAQELLSRAVDAAESYMDSVQEYLQGDSRSRLDGWLARAERWEHDAEALVQRREVRDRRERVEAERKVAELMKPGDPQVRTLLVVIPEDAPVVEE